MRAWSPYEHSYALGYGAAAPKYVDAFFANLRWEQVERRYDARCSSAPDLTLIHPDGPRPAYKPLVPRSEIST